MAELDKRFRNGVAIPSTYSIEHLHLVPGLRQYRSPSTVLSFELRSMT
jgi:hypothetical protein